MSYKEKPLIKVYKYINNSFKLQLILDDYFSCSFQRSKYEAGTFTIEINYNIPNAQLLEEGMFVQFGSDSKDFGLIKKVTDSIGPDGKGSQVRQITGYDARILYKQRIIKNLNFGDSWTFTGCGELCMRKLINSQCGSEAETKRRLPITNTIGSSGIGTDYTVSEAFSNLYDVLVTIATQTEIMWFVEFINEAMVLKFYEGTDRHSTVQFATDYNSLSDGTFEDSTEKYANSIYVGGKGSGENRDIYEGEVGDTSPTGLDRYETFDNASSLENDDEYKNEAVSKLNEFSQTISLSGNGLAKCPYEYKKEYDVGDIITVAFSGKSAVAQIVSITEHWAWGSYDISFEFGKPVQDLNRQLSILLNKIQTYQATADSTKTSNVKYYTLPTETQQPNQDVILDVIGFTGDMGTGKTFKLYFDSNGVGAKTYHVYFKTLTGSGKLTLTTGVSGKTNLEFSGGTYVAIIYVDGEGNVKSGASLNDTAVSPATSWSSEKISSTLNNYASVDQVLPKNTNIANSLRLSSNSQAVVVLGGTQGEIGRVTVNNVAHATSADSASSAATALGLTTASFSKADDSGRNRYVLLVDITTYYNGGWTSTRAPKLGVLGLFFQNRGSTGAYNMASLNAVSCNCAYNAFTINYKVIAGVTYLVPCVVKYTNNHYYLALRLTGSANDIRFVGQTYGAVGFSTQVPVAECTEVVTGGSL